METYVNDLAETIANHRFRRLGGWLLFFFIVGIIATGISIFRFAMDIYIAVQFVFYFALSLGDLMFFEGAMLLYGLLGLLSGLFAIISIIQIFMRKPKFLRNYQISQLMLMSSVTVIILIVVFAFGELDIFFFILVGGVVFVAFLTLFLVPLYFCKSIRVRVYMGSDEYISKAIIKFKNQPPLDASVLKDIDWMH